MKRILSLLFGALMTLLLLSSCNKEPYFTIEGETDIIFDIQGGYRSFKVSSNTDWFITSDESWFTVFPLKGTTSKDPVTVSIACKENETLEKRSATILITAGNIIEKVSVQQTEKSGIQVTSSKEYYISLDEQVLEIEVRSNEPYGVYCDCDWINPYYDLKSTTSDVLRVFVAENTSQYNRKGNIVIRSEHMEEVIAVTQAKMPVITTRETSLDLPYGGGSRSIYTYSNVDFTVSANVEWIHFVQRKPEEERIDYNYIIYMSFDENPSENSREGTIEITQKKGEVKCVIPVTQDYFYIPNGAVDLGIVMTRTDGSQYHLLWRNRNLGSITPEDISDYFAWGETRAKSRYGWNTYAWQRSVGGYYKYVPYNRTDIWDAAGSPDGKTVLDLEDDAAHVQLGSKWRIPRVYEIRALLNQCEWTWTTDNGVNGYKVTGNNGNSIFLPASGYRVHEWEPSEVGKGGYYWSSDLYVEYPGSGRSLNFTSDSHDIGSGGRPSGLTIRPVFE